MIEVLCWIFITAIVFCLVVTGIGLGFFLFMTGCEKYLEMKNRARRSNNKSCQNIQR